MKISKILSGNLINNINIDSLYLFIKVSQQQNTHTDLLDFNRFLVHINYLHFCPKVLNVMFLTNTVHQRYSFNIPLQLLNQCLIF